MQLSKTEPTCEFWKKKNKTKQAHSCKNKPDVVK